ncbi:PREDICTED: uncharacterized protein LOC109483774 [Branchiostoma belcheri]|uniref:Uncharacterized protein LOC109483774 n=1 Tax=Branchiostoma belcheri TaxID=7741 RepID=A0A6P4ZZL4_BRABE|nr:PREDICTED: uncharacterized protein LOC109483774 [Branchiostoma belcheri]KAI8481489.1 hypothetical protein Bbelb_407820 [Branchiostoma belcheri]
MAKSRLSKKETFILVSYVLFFVLLGAAIYDVVVYLHTQEPGVTTQNFIFTVLVIHILAFYTALLGYVYTTQAGATEAGEHMLAVVSLGLNFVLFIARMTMELLVITYRPEAYLQFTDSGK